MHLSWKLIALTAGVRWHVAGVVLAGLLVTGTSILSLVFIGHAIGAVFGGATLPEVMWLLGGAAGAALARFLLLYVKEAMAASTASRVKAVLRARIYQHLLLLGPGYLETKQTGQLVAHAVDGVEALETYHGKYLPQVFITLLAPIGIFAYLWTLQPAIALVFTLAFPLALAAPWAFQRATLRSGRSHWRAWADLSALIVDSLQGLPTLKAFNRSKDRGREIAGRAHALYRATMRALLVNLWGSGLREAVLIAAAALALAIGAVQVANGQLPIRSLIVVLLLGREIFRPLNELSMLYHQGLNGVSASVGIFGLLEDRPTVVDPLSTSPHGPADSSVRFEAVTFGYEGGRRPALRGFDLEVATGTTVALVGPSGAGKTTVVNLLLRMFDPQKGRIRVGGLDLRDLPLHEVRRLFAVVSQETYLFHGSVADNLKLARPDADQAALEAAARAANAHDFIMRLPAGYETNAGERGLRLSGGERQRIAIARALLRDAPILLLDEPTSSVDAANEEVIQEALRRLTQGRTTLLIAHRLSTVADADRIVVMEDGRVVESGRHAELIAANGPYGRLVAAQQTALEPAVTGGAS